MGININNAVELLPKKGQKPTLKELNVTCFKFKKP